MLDRNTDQRCTPYGAVVYIGVHPPADILLARDAPWHRDYSPCRPSIPNAAVAGPGPCSDKPPTCSRTGASYCAGYMLVEADLFRQTCCLLLQKGRSKHAILTL